MRYAFKKARSLRIKDADTGELKVRLFDLKTVTWTNGQDTVYAEGTEGAKLAAFDTNKVSTLTAENGTIDSNYISMAVGSEEETVKDAAGICLPPEIYKLTDPAKFVLKHKAIGEVGNEVKFVYAVDKQKNIVSSYPQAASASATAFAYAPDTKEITLPTGVFKAGDLVMVEYCPKFSEYRRIVNDANKFSKTGRVILDAWFYDICDQVDVPMQVVMPLGKVSGSFDTTIGGEAAVMNVSAEAMADTCNDEAQTLWELYDYDMNKIVDD